MNNRYLCRAKRTDNGEWVIGYYVRGLNMYEKEVHMIFEPTTIFYSHGETDGFVEVDQSTICQCTGKHDIPENKMIYEHDFVSFLDTYSTENGYAEQYCVGEVLWDDEELCFYVTNRLSAESYEVLDDCKVIGNRFDNPELLEVGE